MAYLGQPSVGFFFDKDFFTASCHLPSILRVSGLGPVLVGCFFLAGLDMVWGRLVCEPLSLSRFYRQNRSLAVIQPAVVPKKIVLEIPMQVFAADVVVDAHNAALHKRMAAFRCVRVDFAARVLFSCMANMGMAADEVFADAGISAVLVGHDPRKGVYHFLDCGFERCCRHVRNYAAANLTVPLHRREHGRPFFARPLRCTLEARLTTDKHFIAFDDAAYWRRGWNVWSHREANAVHQEQCAFVTDLAVPLDF